MPQRFYTITSAKYMSVVTSYNSTSFSLVPSKGFAWALQTGFPRVSSTIILTVDLVDIFLLSPVLGYNINVPPTILSYFSISSASGNSSGAL